MGRPLNCHIIARADATEARAAALSSTESKPAPLAQRQLIRRILGRWSVAVDSCIKCIKLRQFDLTYMVASALDVCRSDGA
jgi:hypothetical protein